MRPIINPEILLEYLNNSNYSYFNHINGLMKPIKIWNAFFFNLTDQHSSFKHPNSYGPVLFKIKIESLIKTLIENSIEISVTKIQPHEWTNDQSPSKCWYLDNENVFNSFNKVIGWPDFVLFNSIDGIPINVIDAIVIDQLPHDLNFHKRTAAIFENCLSARNIKNVKISTR